MPFKYVLRWTNNAHERIGVEAWARYQTTPRERKHPSFVIGVIEGGRAILLRDRVEQAIATYGARTFGHTRKVAFPLDDTKAIAEAYRIGLAAAVLSSAVDNDSLNRASRYVLSITDEEVWFWTSKLLDSAMSKDRVIDALCIISGAKPSQTGRSNLQRTLL